MMALAARTAGTSPSLFTATTEHRLGRRDGHHRDATTQTPTHRMRGCARLKAHPGTGAAGGGLRADAGASVPLGALGVRGGGAGDAEAAAVGPPGALHETQAPAHPQGAPPPLATLSRPPAIV